MDKDKMNYYLLHDLYSDVVDAIIITPATKEEVKERIVKAKEVEDYDWQTLVEILPPNTTVIDCFDGKNRIYY